MTIGTEEYTLRDWLVHFHEGRESVWTDVVREFYQRAASDVEIAAYFSGVDMEKLQRHFLAALTLVTHRGLTVDIVARMREVHGSVVGRDGSPITGAVYDRVTSILLGVLLGMGTPAQVISHLDHVLAPLREAIVTG